MTMTRRSFASLLAALPVLAGVAKFRPRPAHVLVADGVTDDADALDAWGRGEPVMHAGRLLGQSLVGLSIATSRGITVTHQDDIVILDCFFKFTGEPMATGRPHYLLEA